jgi:purine-cytosine permease-like protein
MAWIIIAFLLGLLIGVVITALAAAGGNADRRMEEIISREEP